MNNYGNPYLYGTSQYQPYNFSTYQSNPAQQMQQVQPQQVQPVQQPMQQYVKGNYDFSGFFVKDYEEVKNASYTDGVTLYMDREHDKIYLKQINQKGMPEISVFDVVASKETELATPSTKTSEFEEKLNTKIASLREEYDSKINAYEDKISALESQIREIKTSTTNSGKGGK